jgi:hypothetical protein
MEDPGASAGGGAPAGARDARAWDDYLFDLNGFLIRRQAVPAAQLGAVNDAVDGWIADGGEWLGGVHAQPPLGHMAEYGGSPEQRPVQTYHNVVEGGRIFEELVDHPAWIGDVRRFVDNDGLHLWMNFVTVTRGGGGTSLHAGGHLRHLRNSFHYHDGRFHCGNVVVIVALADIGPGDGPTVVIPGSHKSNLANPRVAAERDLGRCLPTLSEVILDVHLQAGDALIFTDAILHGGRPRINPGQRRILVYRYAPFWTRNRFGYEPSESLVERLTAERRAIVRPITPRPAPRRAVVG